MGTRSLAFTSICCPWKRPDGEMMILLFSMPHRLCSLPRFWTRSAFRPQPDFDGFRPGTIVWSRKVPTAAESKETPSGYRLLKLAGYLQQLS